MATKTAKKSSSKAAAPKAKAAASAALKNRGNKAAEGVRNLGEAELGNKQREVQDQLFRLKFQMAMGQTESLNKIRSTRRELARIKTIARARALGIENSGTEKK